MYTDQIAMNLIDLAGNARSKAMEAIETAREAKFDEARHLLQEAQQELNAAHHTQTDLLSASAKGEQITMDILLVHAQDHLTMASISIDFAEEFILLREEMKRLSVGRS